MRNIIKNSFPVIALAILIFLLLVVITRAQPHANITLGASMF